MNFNTLVTLSYIISLLSTFLVKSAHVKNVLRIGSTTIFLVLYKNNFKAPEEGSWGLILLIFSLIIVSGTWSEVILNFICNKIILKRLKKKYNKIKSNPSIEEITLFNSSYDGYFNELKELVNKYNKRSK